MSEQFKAQLLAQASTQANLPWLAAFNQQGQQGFASATWPTRKTEAWKNTPLTSLAAQSFQAPDAQALTDTLRDKANISALNAARLVFVNGQLNTKLSDALALEEVTLFSQANSAQQTLITQHLNSVVQQVPANGHLFNDWNLASLNEGVLIHIGKNQRLERPLHLSFLTTESTQAFTTTARILCLLESGASVTLVEQYDSDDAAQVSFTSAMTEIVVGDNAQLQHYRLQLMQQQALHIGGTHVALGRDSQYQAFHLGAGTELTRNDIVVHHNVGGSHCDVRGVYVPQNTQRIDFHTCIEHKVPHCTSNEVFRGIMNDESRAIFNGRIHIHPQAQKTNAQLSNKNLLLTNNAEVYTKPELEIYADDVKCAHGATVAQMDDKSLFYMQSRGISKVEAEVMLSFGFINELIDALPHPALAAMLRPVLARRFGRENDLAHHTWSHELLGDDA